MDTIVFGEDGSAGADVAWLWINTHTWPGWRVDVVQVSVPDRPAVGSGHQLEPWTPGDPRPLMPDTSLERRHLRATGDPRLVLGACNDAGLLVIGATGAGFLKRWLHLGSTAEWLMHEPPAPLLIVRSAARTHRALVAVDGSVHAQHAVEALRRLPMAPQLHVHVLGVHDGWAEPESGVEQAVATLDAATRSVRSDVERGRASRLILETARDRGCDLVVLGARGKSEFHRRMAGSTTTGLTHAFDGNVLIAN